MEAEPLLYCPKCDALLPTSKFSRNRSKPRGYVWLCKQHASEYFRNLYHTNQALRAKHIARISRTRANWYRKDSVVAQAWHMWVKHKKVPHRVPKWARFKDTIPVYRECRALGKNSRVKYIVPFRCETACGFHVAENLVVYTRPRNPGGRKRLTAKELLDRALKLLRPEPVQQSVYPSNHDDTQALRTSP